MNELERAHFRDRLLEERDELSRELETFDSRSRISRRESTGELTLYPLHAADEGTDAVEEELAYTRASTSGEQLARIDEALETIYHEPDRYGFCQQCGNQIPLTRLEVIPWATFCVACEAEVERASKAVARESRSEE